MRVLIKSFVITSSNLSDNFGTGKMFLAPEVEGFAFPRWMHWPIHAQRFETYDSALVHLQKIAVSDHAYQIEGMLFMEKDENDLRF